MYKKVEICFVVIKQQIQVWNIVELWNTLAEYNNLSQVPHRCCHPQLKYHYYWHLNNIIIYKHKEQNNFKLVLQYCSKYKCEIL